MDKEKITISFMFPVTSGVMGGVQMLLINLIPYIVKHNLANVRLYDYTLGLVKVELDKLGANGYEFISLDDSKWTIPNLGNETFVLTGGLWLTYPKFFRNKQNVKISVWDVYYPFWASLGNFKGVTLPGLRKKLMADLATNNAVFFMEENGLKVFNDENFYKNKPTEIIVPVPVYKKDNNLYLKNYKFNEGNKVNIGYIGRAVDWKMYPVKKIINDLSILNYQVYILIYTNDKEEFIKFIGELPVNVEVSYKVGYCGDALEDDLIKSNITIGYSMGTAALDMAKLGIPTILADFSYNEFPQEYSYKLLHDTRLGNLGEDAARANSDNRISLEVILELDKVEWSGLSFDFVCEKHSISSTADRLINTVRLSTLELNDLKGVVYLIFHVFYILRRLLNKNTMFIGWGLK